MTSLSDLESQARGSPGEPGSQWARQKLNRHYCANFPRLLDALKVATNTLEATGYAQPGFRKLIAELEDAT